MQAVVRCVWFCLQCTCLQCWALSLEGLGRPSPWSHRSTLLYSWGQVIICPIMYICSSLLLILNLPLRTMSCKCARIKIYYNKSSIRTLKLQIRVVNVVNTNFVGQLSGCKLHWVAFSQNIKFGIHLLRFYGMAEGETIVFNLIQGTQTHTLCFTYFDRGEGMGVCGGEINGCHRLQCINTPHTCTVYVHVD